MSGWVVVVVAAAADALCVGRVVALGHGYYFAFAVVGSDGLAVVVVAAQHAAVGHTAAVADWLASLWFAVVNAAR